MLKELYQKQCPCEATASGPRLTLWHEERKDAIVYAGAWAEMACDGCGMPWRRFGLKKVVDKERG